MRKSGPWVQVSRLGNPLFNEVIVPLGEKDRWNARRPGRRQRTSRSTSSSRSSRELLPVLYPGVFPNLAALHEGPRATSYAILLTGIPSGIVAGFQNFTGPTPADMLRLNVAIPPTTSNPNALGLVGGDLAGFPNGRRVFDDVVTIELRAIAGRDDPARRPELHAGRGGRRGLVVPHARGRPLPGDVPVPRHAARRLRHAIVVSHNHDHSKDASARARDARSRAGRRGPRPPHRRRTCTARRSRSAPVGRDDERSHKQVHERPVAGRPLYGAVFDGLPAGEYTLWLDDRPLRRNVAVGRRGRHRHLD